MIEVVEHLVHPTLNPFVVRSDRTKYLFIRQGQVNLCPPSKIGSICWRLGPPGSIGFEEVPPKFRWIDPAETTSRMNSFRYKAKASSTNAAWLPRGRKLRGPSKAFVAIVVFMSALDLYRSISTMTQKTLNLELKCKQITNCSDS